MKKRIPAAFLALALVGGTASAATVSAAEGGLFSAKINFTAGGEKRAGYTIPDYGYMFQEQYFGWTYGWTYLDHSDLTRNHFKGVVDSWKRAAEEGEEELRVADNDRLGTLVHLYENDQWEIELPNGTYTVEVSVGDALYGIPTEKDGEPTGGATIMVEGVTFQEGIAPGPSVYEVVRKDVEVTDGRLTVTTPSLEKVAKINYIDIYQGEQSIVKVNFEKANDYEDFGLPYMKHPNGLTYGWNADYLDHGRNHWSIIMNEKIQQNDYRLATLMHFAEGAVWEIEVPNGEYEVTVAMGDPVYGISGQTGGQDNGGADINVEGVSFIENKVLDKNVYEIVTKKVVVADGKLTVDAGNSWDKVAKINYIDLVQVSSDVPATTPTVAPTATPAPTAQATEAPAETAKPAPTTPSAMPKTGMGGSQSSSTAAVAFAVLAVAAVGAGLIIRKKQAN